MKAKTKSQLTLEYEVSYSTFIKWLKAVPDINLAPNQRLLTPKQVKQVYDYYGNPAIE